MKLSKITWEDKWENYVAFGSPKAPLLYDRHGNSILLDLLKPGTLAIIEVMTQLKGKMTVYEAYLKGIETVFGMTTYNQCGTSLQWLVKLKKQEIRNLKKGIFDEELADYIEAVTKGYKRWCEQQDR